MSHPANCPHCRASLPAPHSRILGVLAVGLAWTIAMTMVFVGILTGPFIIFLLPALVPAGMSMISVAHGWAFAERDCQACGKLVEASSPTRVTSLRPVVARA